MAHTAYIAHHIPGRLRIKLAHAKGNASALQQVKESLAPQSGVRRVEVNPMTGSVVIHYDPDRQNDFLSDLARYAMQENLFVLDAEPHESQTARSLADTLKQLDEASQRATDGAIGLRELFPLGTAAYALFWVDKTLGAPMWLSILFFSFSSYMDLHQEDPSPKLSASLEALRAEMAALREEIRRRT